MKVEHSGVVVTGGASGLGEGIARMVVAGGGSVVIFDLPSSKGIQLAAELGDRARFVPVDVTNPEQVESAVLTAAEQLGRIDVLVKQHHFTGSQGGGQGWDALSVGEIPPGDRSQPDRRL